MFDTVEYNGKHYQAVYGYISTNIYRAALDKWEVGTRYNKNLFLTDGRDFIHAQAYTNTSAGTRGAGFMGVSADAGSPAAGDTTLTAEITTGGLGRADVTTKTHTDNSNSTTMDHTYTASATHTDVRRVALFNASSAGTMVHSGTFTNATLQSGDKLQVIYTLNLG
jgi:hypothetical protein